MQYKFPETGIKATDDLGHQFQKIMQKANRGSIKTRYRYAETGQRFVKWVQPQFKMQKLANLSDKHLVAYAKHLRTQGCTDKYIKNELSGLRYIHSITPHTRHELGYSAKINKEAGLESTPNYRASQKNQAWTREEVDKFAAEAQANGRPKLAKMIKITHETGTRLEEVTTLRRGQVEDALRTGKLHLVNTKGGRPRDVPLSSEARRLLADSIQSVPRGAYVFVPPDIPIHKFKSQCQDYIHRYRDKIQDPARSKDPSRSELHFHGIRHAYAQEKYRSLREQGLDDHEAREKLAEMLGHGREEITYVYVP